MHRAPERDRSRISTAARGDRAMAMNQYAQMSMYQDPLDAPSDGADDMAGSPPARSQYGQQQSPNPFNNTGCGKGSMRHPASPSGKRPGMEPGAYPRSKPVSKYNY